MGRAKGRRPRNSSFQVSRVVQATDTLPPKQSQTSSTPHSSGVWLTSYFSSPIIPDCLSFLLHPNRPDRLTVPCHTFAHTVPPLECPLQPAPPSPQIWILPILQDTARMAPSPGSLPPSSAQHTCLLTPSSSCPNSFWWARTHYRGK